MPFGDTRMISRKWSDHHARYLPSSFNAKVAVAKRSATTYDPATDDTTSTWSTVHAGPARVQRMPGDHPVETAGQHLTGQPYLVEVAADAPAVERGHRVRITESANDPSLAGQDLWVVVAGMGSERFTRSLWCSDAQIDATTGAQVGAP